MPDPNPQDSVRVNPVAGTGRVVNLGITVFVAALFCATELGAQEQGETKITAVRNQVTKSGEGTNSPTDVGHAVKSGEAVVTGEQGLVELKSTDATTVRAGEKSRVAYDPKDRTVKLDRGTVVVDTPDEGGPVKINLGGATYTITTEKSDQAKPNSAQTVDSEKKDRLSKSNAPVSMGQGATNSK